MKALKLALVTITVKDKFVILFLNLKFGRLIYQIW